MTSVHYWFLFFGMRSLTMKGDLLLSIVQLRNLPLLTYYGTRRFNHLKMAQNELLKKEEIDNGTMLFMYEYDHLKNLNICCQNFQWFCVLRQRSCITKQNIFGNYCSFKQKLPVLF